MWPRPWPQPPRFIPEQKTPGWGRTGPERTHTQGLLLEQVPSGWAAGDGLGLIILSTQEQRTLRGGAERTRKRAGSSGTQGTCQSRRNLEPGCCTSSLYTHWDRSECRGPVWWCTWDIRRQEPMSPSTHVLGPSGAPSTGVSRAPIHPNGALSLTDRLWDSAAICQPARGSVGAVEFIESV